MVRADIFARQIEFIGQAAITNAMIGPLVALPGTPLYARMKQTGRLLTGDDRGHARTIASGYTNIVTLISEIRLLEGIARSCDRSMRRKRISNGPLRPSVTSLIPVARENV